jgi:DNA-binding response OmpR family regulator
MTTKARVLVVDDEAVIRSFLVRVLEREGHTVIAASNGAEALDVLQQTTVDLMLSDIRMDQLDGVELLKEARERYPELAVLLLTGHATVESAVAALRHGALNYLLKPVRNEEIVEAVSAALDVRAHQQRGKKLERLAQQFSQVLALEPQPDFYEMPARDRVTLGRLTLDLTGYAATLDGVRLTLTPTEFRLLVKLAQSPGMVFDYVELVRDACGYVCARHEAQEIISTHVRNLRSKLGVEPDRPLYIASVRSVGYRLVEPGSM